jgi:DNA/RNA endonuclease G (NUC1)
VENTTHICERSGKTAFFALEYDADKFAPLWVGYRITDTFGQNGCASMTRQQMRCHFKMDNVEECIDNNEKPGDPFHIDPTLTDLDVDRLGPNAFSGTGHDRGHMAPNSTFSWHACGAYKTFSMANMAAQWGSHNQQLWANLEAQVLYWGVKDGPIHVVTGPIWGKFPSDQFKAIRDGEVEKDTFPKIGELLTKKNGKKLSDDIPRPTGFYKVVFRPGQASEPDRAIAFLTPHTKQKGLVHWQFVAPVKLVEQASGLHFGFPESVKDQPDLAFWRASSREVPKGWSPRTGCDARQPVAGWMADRPLEERVEVCTSVKPIK